MENTIHLKPEEIKSIRYRDEWINYLLSYNPTHIFTLTFANKLDRSTQFISADIVNKFIYQLNNVIYGRKSNKSHKCAVIAELDINNRKHYHILIEEKPDFLASDNIDKLISTYCTRDISPYLHNPDAQVDLIYLEIIKQTWINVGILNNVPTGTANFKQSHEVNEGFKRIKNNTQDLIKTIEYVLKGKELISTNIKSNTRYSEHEGFISEASNISGKRR